MKRTTLALFILGVVGVAFAAPVGAGGNVTSTANEDPVGTYAFSAGGGYKVTVGYFPCGASWTYPDADGNPVTTTDPDAHFWVKVKKGGGWNVEQWAHSVGTLDANLRNLYGFGLTQRAIDTLNADAAAYPCTG